MLYKSSESALVDLCEKCSDHPFSHGLVKSAIGVSLIVAGGILGIQGGLRLGYNPGTSVVDEMALMLVSAGGMGGSIGRILPDSLISLFKPLTNPDETAVVYAYNGGYTNHPSWADKKYGTVITPISSGSKLYRSKGVFFVNDVRINLVGICDTHETRRDVSALDYCSGPFTTKFGVDINGISFSTCVQGNAVSTRTICGEVEQVRDRAYVIVKKGWQSTDFELISLGEAFKVA